MNRIVAPIALLVCVLLAPPAPAAAPDDSAAWSIYIANDNCPDYTWGLTEAETRQAFADIVRGHLDEMNRTDSAPPENQDRYNMAVTQEALCFVEKYPDRKDELVRRIKEGRIFVSPYLCNSLWGLASFEQTVRTLYPARRLEREWGIPRIEWAEHIEEPCLPWGTATILAGCGIRWLSSPFYNYDSTFRGLKTPPLFTYEGPDGSKIRVVMDPWACNRSSYTQGAAILRKPESVLAEWLPHYRSLGAAYPLRAVLASGTHGDINPGSGNHARGFAEGIARYNAAPGPHPKLINATLPMFCRAVDEAEARQPFLPTVRGDFGHSWDSWPVSLAKYAARLREGERQFLAAEALLAVVGRTRPELFKETEADRRRAEWCLCMLSDHAWNGTDERNQRHNADLRKRWSEELLRLAADLRARTWRHAGRPDTGSITVFNPSGRPRGGLVRPEGLPDDRLYEVSYEGRNLPAQLQPPGQGGTLFVSPEIPPYGFSTLQYRLSSSGARTSPKLPYSDTALESPFYRLSLNEETRSIRSLLHKSSGQELLVPGKAASLCRVVHPGIGESDGRLFLGCLDDAGPVRSRLFLGRPTRVHGTSREMGFMVFPYVYADIDRMDFDVLVSKAPSPLAEWLGVVFPVMREGAVLRVETPGGVIRPKPQPEGDLLPGADAKRVVVQGFVDVSMPDGPGVTIVPLDAFLLRLDLDPITFEVLGNDQNHKEVVRDQNGVEEFRFRFALRAHAGPYNQAEAVAFSRDVTMPLIAIPGAAPAQVLGASPVEVDPSRAIATAFKPADDLREGGSILRLWETAGKDGPLAIRIPGYGRAILTDLVERDIKELPIADGVVAVPIRPHGFAAVRLIP